MPVLAAGAAAVVILLAHTIGERAAGCVAGCGLVLLALFVGIVGIEHGNAPVGAYLGIGAGAMLTVTGLAAVAAARLSSSRASL